MRKPNGSEAAAEPVADGELDALFAVYAGFSRIALAVSGGPDSLALMHLSVAWRARLTGARPDFVVLTLDHGLRPEAAEEADRVAEAATVLGLNCHVSVRPTPRSRIGVQEQARADRYRILGEAAHSLEAEALVTGHTLDDQAETLLMRLARGSGIDGLSAMSPSGRLGDLKLLRPLLSVPKARLEASLRARGVTWTLDPSNANRAFERARLRGLMPTLAAEGLTADALALSARRLARGRAALEAIASEAVNRLVTVHDQGYFSIARLGFDALAEDIRLRLLGALLGALGTPGQPQRLARLERLVLTLAREAETVNSLTGCRIDANRQRVLLLREPGRLGLPQLLLAQGESAVWDRRFRVHLANSSHAGVLIRAFTAPELTGETAVAARASRLPPAILLATPSAWRGGTLIACPALKITCAGLSFTLTLPGTGDALFSHGRDHLP